MSLGAFGLSRHLNRRRKCGVLLLLLKFVELVATYVEQLHKCVQAQSPFRSV